MQLFDDRLVDVVEEPGGRPVDGGTGHRVTSGHDWSGVWRTERL
jgi:hypothetical protein